MSVIEVGGGDQRGKSASDWAVGGVVAAAQQQAAHEASLMFADDF